MLHISGIILFVNRLRDLDDTAILLNRFHCAVSSRSIGTAQFSE